MGPRRPNLRSKTADFIAGNADLRPKRADFRAGNASLSPGTGLRGLI